MIKDYIEEEGRNILGFDRLNRPVYEKNIVTDALGRRFIIDKQGRAYIYDESRTKYPFFARLSELSGPTLEAPLQPQRPAPSKE